MSNRFNDILNDLNDYMRSQSRCASDCEHDNDEYMEELEDALELEMVKRKLKKLKQSKAEEGDFLEVEDSENESIEQEMMEYKKDFFDMSVGSIKAIMTHAQEILAALDNPTVAENLTESWLQGKIAITEDYMRTIHDFVMFVSDAADTKSSDRPGLWENIRRKKERMGKKYRPAKPGDKDRPDSDQWKKLTK